MKSKVPKEEIGPSATPSRAPKPSVAARRFARAGFRPAAGSLRVATAAQLSSSVQLDLDDAWQFELGAYGRLRGNEDGTTFVGPPDDISGFASP